jgi:DNA-binding CsgD family transcriptional regulator
VNELTEREEDVLFLVSHGYSNEEIGVILDISASTVRTHVQNILSRLNVHNKAHAVATWIRSGDDGGASERLVQRVRDDERGQNVKRPGTRYDLRGKHIRGLRTHRG